MSRLRFVVLLAVLAALASAAVACGGDDEGSADSPGEPGLNRVEREAVGLLEQASLDGLESGVVDLSLSVSSAGTKGGQIEVGLSGPFRRGKGDLPQTDLAVSVEGKAEGEQIAFEGHLTLLSDRAFVNYEGTWYEVDPKTLGWVVTSFLPAKPGTGKKAGITALGSCLAAAGDLDVEDFLVDVSSKGARVDGAQTTKVSGELDPDRVLDAIVRLANDPSCSAQLLAAGRSAEEVERNADELSGAATNATLDVYLGRDGIVRKVTAGLTADPKGADRDEVEIELAATLSEVNEGPPIKPRSATKPSLALLERLGVSGFEAAFFFSNPEALGTMLDLIAADAFPSLEG